MAHFAKLDENNIVIEVNVVNNDVITIDGVESEQAGIDFLTDLYGHTLWKQTSYNGSFRKMYAGIGYSYNKDYDVFLPPKPFPSWHLNTELLEWEAPISRPNSENKMYLWNEKNQVWTEENNHILPE
jgi:hypothetical protein